MSEPMDATATTTTTTTKSQSPEARATAYFELAVSLYLFRWPALSLAVEHGWGGHDSADKRDWLGGVLVDLFPPPGAPGVGGGGGGGDVVVVPAEVEDVEDVVVQVMSDEFQVVLEDESAYVLASAIVRAWTDCRAGKFDGIEALKVQFQAQADKKATATATAAMGGRRRGNDIGEESDSSSGTDAELDPEESGAGEEAMEVDHPAHRHQQQQQEPVVDEDGFELVQGKGKKGRRK